MHKHGVKQSFGFYTVFLKEVKCGDLIKKETGKSAQEYIQSKLMTMVKEKIFELGFKYPQHFTRLFKQRVGRAPNEYWTLN
jgi:AraC-like DNA-binding protein